MNRFIAPALLISSLFLSGYTFYETKSSGGEQFPLRWYQDEVQLVTEKNLTRDVPHADALQAINNSLDTWNSIDCLHSTFMNMGEVSNVDAMNTDRAGNRSGNNIVIFENEDEWEDSRTDDQPYDTSLTIALSTMFHVKNTGEIKSFAVEFNDTAFLFGTAGQEDRLDIQNTLTHELGHVLGLNHAGIETPVYWEQTMYYQASPGETSKQTLGPDDEAGICGLYGTDWAGLIEVEDTGCSVAGGPDRKVAVNPAVFIGLVILAMLPIIYRRRGRYRT